MTTAAGPHDSSGGSGSGMEHITAQLRDLGVSELPSFPDLPLWPEHNPLDLYRAIITAQLQLITAATPATILAALQSRQDLKHGDLVLPVSALRLPGRTPPDELARDIVARFDSPLVRPRADRANVGFFFAPGPFARLVVPAILARGDGFGFNAGLGLENPRDPDSRRKKVVVEFSSPNIAKEFHTGHLRSTIIGGFLVKLYQLAGWQTHAMNYLGDWGKQYGVLTQGFEKYGSEEGLTRDPVKHLNEVYVRINQDHAKEQEEFKRLTERKEALEKVKNPPKSKKPAKAKKGAAAAAVAAEPETEVKWSEKQEQELRQVEAEMGAENQRLTQKPSIDEKARQFFARMCRGDAEALRDWQRFRQLSIEAYVEMYKRLNIEFDEYSGESTVREADMDRAAAALRARGISEDSRGAVIVDFAKHGAPQLMRVLIIKRDGTSLYITRDVAAALERFERHGFDKMLYVVASQQEMHLAQSFRLLELLGTPWDAVAARCEHINFGMVKDPHGQTMSTRRGTVVSLADSLDVVRDTMHDVMRQNAAKYGRVADPETTADRLAVSAVMVQDYSGKRINGYSFDLARMTSFEGDTGPYLQYSHARLCSMEGRSGLSRAALMAADAAPAVTATPEGTELLRALAQWPDVFVQALRTREPITVLTYLFKMTHLLSACYDARAEGQGEGGGLGSKTMSVVYTEDPERKAALMALYAAARQVLGNGMRLLGLTPVERM